MLGAPLSPLLPPKKAVQKKGRLPLIAYRSPLEQFRYIEGIQRLGYKLPEAMVEIVRLHMRLDAALTEAGIDLHKFAVAEGFAARNSVHDSVAWLPDAVAKLLHLGAEAYRREHPDTDVSMDRPESPATLPKK